MSVSFSRFNPLRAAGPEPGGGASPKAVRELPVWLMRFLYGAFLAFGLYYLATRQDYGEAFSAWGIALLFDPFDQSVKWEQRPLYQRCWLIAHLGLVMGVATLWILL